MFAQTHFTMLAWSTPNVIKKIQRMYVLQHNVGILLLNLTLQASKFSKFDSSNAGVGTDKAYGEYLCRGLASLQICSDCIGYAVEYLAQYCIHNKVGIVWYKDSMIRYAVSASYPWDDV